MLPAKMKEHMCRLNPGNVRLLWLICKETKDAFPCLTIGQVFTADWLDSLCSQKRNHSARAGHNTGSHQSRSERLACTAEQQLTFTQESCQCFLRTWITQTRITQLRKRAAADRLMRSLQMTHGVHLLPSSGNVAVSFAYICLDLQFCVLSSLLLPCTTVCHSFTPSFFTENGQLLQFKAYWTLFSKMDMHEWKISCDRILYCIF